MAVLNKSSMEKNQFEVVTTSHWLQAIVMLLLGQGEIFLFLKAGDKISRKKHPPFSRQFLSSYWICRLQGEVHAQELPI